MTLVGQANRTMILALLCVASFAVTMLMGVGMLIGSDVDGRLSERIGKRPVIVATSAACAVLAILEMNAPWLLAAAPLRLVFGAFGGARFATHQAVLTECGRSHGGR